MDFQSQARIYNPEEQKTNIVVIGAGSTGSFLSLTLAKMGLEKIKVIDYDKVEEKNIPNQFFRMQDVGKYKVEALKEIINEFTGTQIEIENIKIEDNYEFDFDLNTIFIFCLDNMEGRELIYNKIKEFPIKLIDTRFGSEGFSVHIVDLGDETEKELYEKSLGLSIMETPCGEKGVIYSILSLASEVCNIVKQIDKEEDFVNLLKREMKTYRFIARKK